MAEPLPICALCGQPTAESFTWHDYVHIHQACGNTASEIVTYNRRALEKMLARPQSRPPYTLDELREASRA